MSSGLDIWVFKPGRNSLRELLSLYLGEAAEIEVVRGEHGKPRLADGGLEFNLSHSGEIGLIAFSPARPVGIDVEKEVPGHNFLGLAERALGADAVAALREAAPGERAPIFYNRWVRHEARLKCLGVGIFRPEPEVPMEVEVEDLDVSPGYAAAVALG